MSATRMNDCSRPQAVLHMALELGERTWKLGFTTGLGQKPRRKEIDARDTEALGREIQAAKERFRLPADTPVVSCYEAGREGFWLHRWLLSKGVQNAIVDSSSIHVNRRQRRAKTDRLDVENLLKMLVRWQMGEKDVWGVVRVPTVEEEDARQLHRELETLRHEQTSHSNRIQGLLASQGVAISVNRHFPKALKEARLWDGSPLPADLRQRLLREFARMQGANRQIRALEKERARRMRAMAIEIAWGWLKFQSQSALPLWYQRRFGHGNKRLRRIGIVALARKLLVALWQYLQTGVPPEGAELTDWRGKIHYTSRLA